MKILLRASCDVTSISMVLVGRLEVWKRPLFGKTKQERRSGSRAESFLLWPMTIITQ